jgi:hypothetical protein
LPTSLTDGLVDDRVRVAAGLLALLAATAGVVTLSSRAVVLDERSPLLLAVRLLIPALLALGGHLAARRGDDRGPALLVALGLLLVPGVAGDLLAVTRVSDLHPLALGGLAQSSLGVLAAGLAWLRLGTPPRGRATFALLGPPARALTVGAVVVLALAELYPSVTGPLVGALQPLLVVLGASAFPTVLAALGVALIAVVAGRAEPAAAALVLASLGAVTLGQVALLLEDVLGGRVAATVWFWLRLLGGVVVAATALRVARLSSRTPAGTHGAGQ